MTLGGAVVAALGVVVVGSVTLVAQLPQPSSIWPQTVAGWVTLFVSFATAFGLLYAFHRFSLRPLEERMTRTEHAMKEQVATHKKAIETEFDAFHRTVKQELNGFGARVENVQETQRTHEGLMDGIRETLVEIREDRRHMRETVNEIKATQLRDQDALRQFESRIMEALRQYPRDHRDHREGR